MARTQRKEVNYRKAQKKVGRKQARKKAKYYVWKHQFWAIFASDWNVASKRDG